MYILYDVSVSLYMYQHRGSIGWQKHFLRTAYYQIWPPLTYAEVKCHFAVETVW